MSAGWPWRLILDVDIGSSLHLDEAYLPTWASSGFWLISECLGWDDWSYSTVLQQASSSMCSCNQEEATKWTEICKQFSNLLLASHLLTDVTKVESRGGVVHLLWRVERGKLCGWEKVAVIHPLSRTNRGQKGFWSYTVFCILLCNIT